MAHFKIEWIEVKSPEWKVCSLKSENGEMLTDVSINKIDKKTGKEAFTNWEEIALERDVDGELWTSPAGKKYLFAPKVSNSGQFKGNRTAQMEKVMDKKASQIANAQGNKDLGIKITSTMNNAINIVIAQIANDPIVSKDSGQIKKMIKQWRAWIWENWEAEEKDFQPFPSNEPVIDLNEGFDNI